MLFGGVFGWAATHYFSESAAFAGLRGQGWAVGVGLLLLLPVLYLIVVGVHELGHVGAGLWRGFTFYGLTIGPFSWRPAADGRIRTERNRNLNTAGGLAVMLPTDTPRLRQDFMWFAAGGPLASLVLAVVLWAVATYALPTGVLSGIVLIAALLSVAIFLVTILPFRSGGFASDGMRILTFLRDSSTARADLTALRAMAQLRAGRPHTDLPDAELAAAAADPSVSEQQRVAMDYYRYYYALAHGEVDRAAELFGSVLDRIDVFPAGTHGAFYLEQAVFEARYRRDLPAARAALERYTPGPLTEAVSVPLATAAVADLAGDRATLAAQLPLIEAGLDRMTDQGRRRLVETWLAEWRAAAQPEGGAVR